MRRRSVLLTAATAFCVLSAVVLAGGKGPVAGHGKRRAKKGVASAATLAAPAPTPSASASSSVAPLASASALPVLPSTQAASGKLSITAGTKVLVFGDSMVDAGFAQKLRKLVEARGGTLVHDGWTSATTSTWSKGDRLDNLLFVHKPDIVIIALGANEVFLPSPEAVAPRVRAIVAKLAPRTCVWVSPPLWKGETGIVGVERANSAPCGFYDSGSVKVERAKDGIHPTPKGGADWADAVWGAIVD
jgi:lysophospholipase L1-like esterase